MGLSALMPKPTPYFEHKVKVAHRVYVENGGTLKFEEFLQLTWAIHKIESTLSTTAIP